MAVDEKDYLKGWTVQAGPAPEAPETVPGQVVTPEQLPDKKVLEKNGVDVDQLFAGVVVAVDEHEKAVLRGEDPKGEAPGEFSEAKEADKADDAKDEKDAEAEKPAAKKSAKK